MKSKRSMLNSTVILMVAVLLVTTLMVSACVSSAGGMSKFPTGRFVHEQFDWYVFEFDEDGTYRFFWESSGVSSYSGKYAINGNLYTEMTHDSPEAPKIPVTYFWTFDGKNLTFELWGEDVNSARKRDYDHQTFIKSE